MRAVPVQPLLKTEFTATANQSGKVPNVSPGFGVHVRLGSDHGY